MRCKYQISRQPFKNVEGFVVCKVRGAHVRNALEVDFALGTNGFVTSQCPKDEIWVESTLTGMDLDAIIIHEVFEALYMWPKELGGKYGWKYEQAHKKATELERQYRRTGTLTKVQTTFADLRVVSREEHALDAMYRDMEDGSDELYTEDEEEYMKARGLVDWDDEGAENYDKQYNDRGEEAVVQVPQK